MSLGETAAVVETHLRLDDVDQQYTEHVPVHHSKLDYYRHRGSFVQS
jgi:hypothetical protein